ncbi:reverse transcriptase-like protein [Novosphingobium sp. 9]|uniref:reverse transcriptase-like protein n=1 Tax=Novosphingobium sp. 9 TaxID=2025349 RepID=UPI0021B56E80|nr:reverse transcriptase-like protein [Novosphingobium sp. 9]
MTRRRVKVFFDGGARPNPGPSEAAVVVRGEVHLFDDPTRVDNSDAEWRALLHALELSQKLGLTDVELIGDAREIIDKANLALTTGIATNPHAARLLALAAESPPARIGWIKREQNLAGIALAKRHPR